MSTPRVGETLRAPVKAEPSSAVTTRRPASPMTPPRKQARRSCADTNVSSPKVAKASAANSRTGAPKLALLGSEVEALLLRGVKAEPFSKAQMSYAQVVKLSCRVAKAHFSDFWPGSVAIVVAGAEERVRSLTWQWGASCLASIVYSPHHWALAAFTSSEPAQAVFYDGLGGAESKTCMDMAVAFCQHAHEIGWLPTVPAIQEARCPAQRDTWSCGHRVGLVLNYVLERFANSKVLPTAVPEAICSEDQLDNLLELSRKAARPATETPSDAAASVSKKAKTEHVKPTPAQPMSLSPTEGVPRKQHLERSPADTDMSTPRATVSRSSGSKAGLAPTGGGRAPKAKKRDQSKKATDARATALQALAAVEIDHTTFQKEHAQEKAAAAAGHWQAFLEAVAMPERLVDCLVCAELRRRALKPDQEGGKQAGQPARDGSDALVGLNALDEPAAPALKPAAKGRPRKDAALFDIHRWIRVNRPGIYSMTPASYSAKCTYHCHACDKKVNFWSQHSLSKMNGAQGHEFSDRHTRGLAALENGRREFNEVCAPAAEVAPLQDAEAPKCCGISLAEGPAADLRDSVQTFMYFGQPRTLFKDSEKDPMAAVTLCMQGDVIRIQGKDCLGTAGGTCKNCRRACLLPSFRSHIAKKAAFIDQVVFAWKLFHCDEKQAMQHAAKMRRADYVRAELAGLDVEELIGGNQDKLTIARNISHRAVCIPVHRRSAALQQFLDGYLVQAHLFHADGAEASAHGALAAALGSAVAAGAVRQLDIRLAAKMASGALRKDSLIQSLTTTFLMTCQQAMEPRQRSHSTRHVDLDALQDALSVLGRSEQVDQMMQRFGLNTKALPKAPIESPCLPNAFVSLRTDKELACTIQRGLSLLRLCGQRSHVLIDETVWCPSFEQVSSLRSTESGEKETAYVGGCWDADAKADYSYLPTSQYKAADLVKDTLECAAFFSISFARFRVFQSDV